MINKYTQELTKNNAKLNISEELIALQIEYRKDGVPTILTDGLNELLLIMSIKNPKSILELGTATGCSAIAMLLANKTAHLTTIEKNREMRNKALENFEKFGVSDRITSLIGDSLDVVMNLTSKYDFIFLDCNKAGYATLYPLLKDLLNDGGVIFADNVLFRGYVSGENECPKEYKTLIKKIDNYNQISSKDKDMITCFFDVGDGIAVSYKK